MKTLAIIFNIFIPGVGSFFIGRAGQGIGQILIWGLGFMLTVFTLGFGGIIGIPMMMGAFVWGLVTAIGAQPATINVNLNGSLPRETIEQPNEA